MFLEAISHEPAPKVSAALGLLTLEVEKFVPGLPLKKVKVYVPKLPI
jgi:hypothetical protein